VALWCLEEASWCLEEDGDSGYGKGLRSNPVLRWKTDHGISSEPTALHRQFFNCRQSPDLSIIEDYWSYPKAHVRKRPHWTDELVDELA